MNVVYVVQNVNGSRSALQSKPTLTVSTVETNSEMIAGLTNLLINDNTQNLLLSKVPFKGLIPKNVLIIAS